VSPVEDIISRLNDEDEPLTAPKAVSRARLQELEAEARYHRERYELYRAKTHSARPTTDTRLRELERMHQGAASRLRRAQQLAKPGSA